MEAFADKLSPRMSSEDTITELTKELGLVDKHSNNESFTDNLESDNTSSSRRLTSFCDDTADCVSGAARKTTIDEDNSSENNSINETENEEEREVLEMNLTTDEKESSKNKAVIKKEEGNIFFKEKNYTAALHLYTESLKMCPLFFKKERAFMFSNRAATYVKLGEYKKALDDCDKAIELDAQYLRAIIRRAQVKEELKQFEEALADWKMVLELHSDHHEAIAATKYLPIKIAERNEELKAEMFDKLKSLGNVILSPFGLSTDNFKMIPNGEGGYSIQFEQNKP